MVGYRASFNCNNMIVCQNLVSTNLYNQIHIVLAVVYIIYISVYANNIIYVNYILHLHALCAHLSLTLNFNLRDTLKLRIMQRIINRASLSGMHTTYVHTLCKISIYTASAQLRLASFSVDQPLVKFRLFPFQGAASPRLSATSLSASYIDRSFSYLTLRSSRLFPDPRVNDWVMMSSPFPTLMICMSYAYFSKVLGPKLMENRKPFDLRRTLITYNLLQTFFSTWIFYEVCFFSYHGQLFFLSITVGLLLLKRLTRFHINTRSLQRRIEV